MSEVEAILHEHFLIAFGSFGLSNHFLADAARVSHFLFFRESGHILLHLLVISNFLR